MEALLDWARGPAFTFSVAFLVLGLVRHVLLTSFEMHRILRRAGDRTVPYRQALSATLRWLVPISKLRHDFLYSLTSMLFHVGVLIVPLFLGGHVALWERTLGISWMAIPNRIADILTIIAVVAAVALVVQRASARTTRSLSRPSDYWLPLFVALPFATGFLVMHPTWNLCSHQAILLIHVCCGNLLMVAIPMTRLSHAVLLPGVQVISELGWRWPPFAGSKVGAVLQEQGEQP